MIFGKILMGVVTSLALGFAAIVQPAAAQTPVSCPPGYYYLPGTGCEIVTNSTLNYSQLNYSYGSSGYPPPTYAAPYGYPYGYPYYAPYAVIGGIGFSGRFHDRDGRRDMGHR
jgi:hypothetical protein